MKSLNLRGQRFGHLIVLKSAEKVNGLTAWLCHCDCGNEAIVQTKQLRNGHTVSCGHLKRDRSHTVAPGYEAKRINGVATFLLDKNRKVRSDSSTGITGVKVKRAHDGSTRYVASITVAGVRHYLGTFETLEKAGLARKRGEDEFIPNK